VLHVIGSISTLETGVASDASGDWCKVPVVECVSPSGHAVDIWAYRACPASAQYQSTPVLHMVTYRHLMGKILILTPRGPSQNPTLVTFKAWSFA
jgi:hypothetical protein